MDGRGSQDSRMPTVDPKFLSQIRYRCIGPTRGGRVVAVAADPKQPGGLLLRRRRRRRVEERRRRPVLGERDRRFPDHRIDRRAGGRPVRRQRDLRRHGRVDDPHRRHPRRRRLQVDRRRGDLAPHRPRRIPPHRRDPRPPRRSRRRVRRRARPRVEGQPRARSVPLEGRRRDLGTRAPRQRTRRRRRRVARPEQPADHLRHDLAGPPHVLVDRQRRSRQRAVALPRRRRHLGEHQHAPGHARRERSARSASSVSPARSGRVFAMVEAEGRTRGLYRSDDIGETWEKVSSNPDLGWRPVVLPARHRPPDRRRRSVRDEHEGVAVDRRRQDLRRSSTPRTATTTRCGSIRRTPTA